ncbi:C-C motif chemokine 20a.3 [Embiotoca jacksoni]|uniref:C-C motif chemokine 20a.3 n=1 Tax=Embiotoca jacksoni TaxID=100190 RepID=UPI003704B9E6
MQSIKVTVMAITLLTVCLLATDTSAVRADCCPKYMKGKLRFSIIRGYSVQTVKEMCDIDAIIFHTTKGKACTDPSLRWVMIYVNLLGSEAQKVHINTSQAQE